MKTRDPDHTGAQLMSPIKPGTLCLLIDGIAPIGPCFRGRSVTVVRHEGFYDHGNETEPRYLIEVHQFDRLLYLGRSNLQPILPPSIDDQVERAIGNPQLEVV